MKQLNLYYLGGGGVNPDIPDGKTITPINDVTIWQQCAGLDPVYNSLGAVLADSGYVAALMSDDNAVDYLVRSTDWATNQALVPSMTSNTTPSGTCSASSSFTGLQPYFAFDNNESTAWKGNSNTATLTYEFENDVYINKMYLYTSSNVGNFNLNNFILEVSNDGTNYETLVPTTSYPSLNTKLSLNIDNSTTYKYYRLIAISSSNYCAVSELQFYSMGISSNETAMQYIGASDYAANTLLSDSTWREAIVTSNYFEIILSESVPTMTSNTTPSGIASGTTTYSGDYAYYKAFNGGDVVAGTNRGWLPSTSDTFGKAKVIYDYGIDNNVIIYKARYSTLYGNSMKATFKLAGSDDGITFTDISDNFTFGFSSISHGYTNTLTSANTSYRYIAAIFMSIDSGGGLTSGNGYKFQYYIRKFGGVQTWLKAANIKKNYISLSQILNDTETLTSLMNNHNAVDYLVTVKNWITTITSNEAAMTAIGNSNYASITLLNDPKWLLAIYNSIYKDSVFNVVNPIMTTNTTPSGESYSNYQITANAYMAFDNNTTTKLQASPDRYNHDACYDFGEDVAIYVMTYNVDYYDVNVQFQYSTDNSNWVAASTPITMPSHSGIQTGLIYASSSSFARYWRFYGEQSSAGGGNITEIRFYGRKDV